MPLRPELYAQLKRLFRHVEIANNGEPMQRRLMDVAGRKETMIDHFGEIYRISCPFCKENRKRLHINHMWGLWDEVTESRNLYLIKCFNEDCLKDHQRRQSLYNDVFGGIFDHDHDELLTGDLKESAVSRPAFWPGPMTPIHKLEPSHPAVRYLVTRNFDVLSLHHLFGIGYCYEAGTDVYAAGNRIIIPVFFEKELIGWQARYIGEPPLTSIPKYYNMPGWKKSQSVYNYDSAIKYNHVVICEGPTDVWRYGPEAVCIFGKCASQGQLRLLVKWPVHIVLLDGDVSEQKDTNKMVDALKGMNCISKQLVISLPKDVDPADMDTNSLRSRVAVVAFHAGVTLSLRQPDETQTCDRGL